MDCGGVQWVAGDVVDSTQPWVAGSVAAEVHKLQCSGSEMQHRGAQLVGECGRFSACS